MIIETKEERAARGLPIGNAVPYQAMGGLTGFGSLADGYMRLDDSGIGAPSREFLEKPIGFILLIKFIREKKWESNRSRPSGYASTDLKGIQIDPLF